MKNNIPMEGVVELFSSSNIFVDEEGLVPLSNIYSIAVERNLDGGKCEPSQYFRKKNVRKSGASGKVSDFAGDGWYFVEHVAKELNLHAVHIKLAIRSVKGGTA